MNAPFLPPLRGTPLTPGPRNRGVALVIVLAMLVLLSGLLIAFFSMALTERTAAKVSASTIEVKQVADTTVNLVTTLLRDGTSVTDQGLGWSARPGAIMTFGRTPLTDNKIFKLYSADEMVQPLSSYDPNKDSYWTGTDLKLQFGYTDLNDPGLSEDGTYVFPVINPKAKYDVKGESISTNKPLVEGFKCADLYDPVRKDEFKKALPLLPLPVKWLYQLKDGSLGTLETLIANSDPKKRPSRNNPIVARTAFWTDDESSRININTASEPTYWGTPWASSYQEIGDTIAGTAAVTSDAQSRSLNLAVAQPLQGEFQRYPGHPATTSLSPVFRNLFDPAPSSRSDKDYKDIVYQLVPRIYSDQAYGRSGSNNLSTAAATRNMSPPPTGSAPQGTTLPYDLDRLYASADELIFRAARREIATGNLLANSDSNRYLPNASGELLSPRVVDRLRFFVSASSRAPELNAFGRPRVAIWPIPKEGGPSKPTPNLRTGFDKAFAYTSTIWPTNPTTGTKSVSDQRGYHFMRQVGNDSGTVDVTLGTDNGSRSMTKDFDGIPENKRVYTYLQNCMKTPLPGLTKSLKDKLGLDSDQVLTEVFDYIRTTNLVDTTGLQANGSTVAGAASQYTPKYIRDSNVTSGSTVQPAEWSGQVIPIKINDTQGLGRFLTLTEVAIAFFVPNVRDNGTPVSAPYPAPSNSIANTMQAVLIFEFSTPSGGYVGLRDTFSFTVTQLEKMDIIAAGTGNGALDIFPTVGTTGMVGSNLVEVNALNSAFGRSHTPNRGFTSSMMKWKDGVTPNAGTDATLAKTFTVSGSATVDRNFYPFLSKQIPIPVTAGSTFIMRGGKYRLDLYAGSRTIDPSKKVQSIEFDFTPSPGSQDVTLPKPRMPKAGATATTYVGRKFESNVGTEAVESDFFGLDGADTVRSVELNGATKGDWRLSQALGGTTPLQSFYPRLGVAGMSGAYYVPTTTIVHGLKYGHADPAPGGAPAQDQARWAPNSEIRPSKPPELPEQPGGATNFALKGIKRFDGGQGDFDRGVSKHADGPLTNKPDEGNIRFGTEATYLRYPYMSGPNSRLLDDANFSPNRLVASPVAFGSLPTGVKRMQPWQTLLFRPDRFGTGDTSHPGADKGDGAPPEHHLLDLFWMPVVEPYAISEPSSTAGKINMNYMAAPFSYLVQGAAQRYFVRDTGMRAALKAVKLVAVRSDMDDGGHFEGIPDESSPAGRLTRFDIDPDKTLEDFEIRQTDAKSGFFRAASEICEMDLYPAGTTKANGQPVPTGTDSYTASPIPPTTKTSLSASRSAWGTFWTTTNGLSGDNGRELPYNQLYPRLTTKSNVFTVYLRSQVVQVPPGYYAPTASGELDMNKLKLDYTTRGDVVNVLSEYRGSSTIERFIDPNDPALMTWVNEPSNSEDPNNPAKRGSLDPYYRFRVLNTKRFTP